MSGKQLANVWHIRDREDGGKMSNKIIFVENILQKDGSIKKNIEVEEKPHYTYYVTKQEEWLDKPVNYIEAALVDSVTVPFDDLYYHMAKSSGQLGFYKSCKANGKWRELRNLNKDANLHLTDMDLADYKIREWIDRNKHDTAVMPISKAFYDIEVDTIHHRGFPEPSLAPCPVNLISYIHQPTMTVHGFILRNTENASQTKFLEWLEEDGNEEAFVAGMIEEMNEPPKKESKAVFQKVKDLKIHIFDEEMDLIAAFFKLLQADKPDFLGAWNGIFDILTLANRVRARGKSVEKMFCPPEFPYKEVDIREDTFSSDYRTRNSVMNVTGYTQFVEMQECFAKIRATMGMRESYSLESILLDEELESKYEYEGEIQDAVYVNFESFFKYSLYDSFRLYQLEEKNNDMDLLYNMGLMTATRFNKVMTKTTSIRNFAAMVLEPQGYLLSNNHNRLKEEEEKKKFKGAFVALPELMDAVGVPISADGRRSNRVFENVVDEDLSAMYPSIILSGNIDADTMIGKIMSELRPELDDHIPNILAERDVIRIGNELLGLPTVEDVVNDLAELLAD
jgi:DNA polymerase elongation subunit (family B)